MRMTSAHSANMPYCPPGYSLWWNGHAYQCVPATAPPPRVDPPRTGTPPRAATTRLSTGRRIRRAQDLRRVIPPGIRPSARAMIPPGIRPSPQYLAGLGEAGDFDAAATAWGALSTASLGLSAYHGYKRNDSVGWGLWWGLMGGLFPVITPAIALAQGFGDRKRG